ncbi:TPA: hypothetical protein DIC38_02025 [Candidatus Nomurabacteria bacterium]|nr:MAG: hypothetical protein O210_OD1C00001G0327 [Parcubacteria bacterium RAAC4_OD1_1]HCY26434.1 hypothetical protein [Candidatus Nomurabacteria bacterium]
MEKYYFQHEGKVIETDNRFKHVMAITLDPRTNYKEGIIRCITNREGDVQIKGYKDRSELYKISGDSLESFKIGERLNIKNETEILDKLLEKDWDFIGLEDPDIWIDKETDLMHMYFTIPIRYIDKTKKIKIHLGHAVGKDLDSLEMTEPVLMDLGEMSAKEVSIAPLNSKCFRYNLIESRDHQTDTTYSIVKVAIAKEMNQSWGYGETVFHPKENNILWIGGHASPGPLFPKSFIDVGEGKLLGVINGREANQKLSDGKIKYGMFSVGLFIYDYENGKIDWVSSEPFIQDSEAVTITFASQFVETAQGEGILYAHVDDSFVRAYTLKAESIKSLLSNK